MTFKHIHYRLTALMLTAQQHWLVVCAVIALGLISSAAHASNGGVEVRPFTPSGLPTYSVQSGLQVSVDTTWTGNRGYRPVKITLSAPKPSTADTQITVNFHANSWRYNQQSISVEQDFEFPQGKTSASTTVLVPQYLDWNYIGWDVWVDGVKDEELCMQYMGFNATNNNSLAVGVLTLDANSNLFSSFVPEIAGYSLEVHLLQPIDLPEHWLGYTSFDVLLTTIKDLQLAQANSPEQFAELRRWVRSGGNLMVLKVGQDFSQLVDLEKLLVPNIDEEPVEIRPQAAPLGQWRFVKLKDSSTRVDALAALTMDSPQRQEPLTKAEIRDLVNPEQAIDSRRWFVARGFGYGTVVAFQEDISSIGGSEIAFSRSMLNENLHWATRHGNDPGGGNPDFNNLLIPDVGIAPVFEFQLLISLFVIAIGPVNYWFLKRNNQLPLMLVTVPLAAMLATGLLFGYGLLADGIGSRVRARSMTFLDQKSGESTSWARLSYYAGIAPSDGLQLPNDTAIYPLLPGRSRNNNFGRQYASRQRTLEWDKQQNLKLGWLASRTPTQYLAITARPSKKQLVFDQTPESLSVTNGLGTSVVALVVQDHQGEFFHCDAIEPGGSAKLSSNTYIKATMKLRTLLVKNLPELPPGYVDNRRRRDSGIGTDQSLMETQFEAIVSPLAKGWGNGTYIAVTATGIEIPLGLEDVTESNSFHVVRGTW